MSEGKLRILNMVKEGKLTAQEGLELLEALQDEEVEVIAPEKKSAKSSGKLRVRISDTLTGKVKVNVSVPLLRGISALIPTEAKVAAEDVDFDALADNPGSKNTPKLVDVVSNEPGRRGRRVEIFFE